MIKKFLLLFAALSLPLQASASVQITEIMYDVSGSDSGREWVEITNTGASSIDASIYKFFEDNTNHALTLLQGTGILLPNASAVLVEDQAKFLADNPGYSGALLKASFSLGNSAETIGVKDTALTLLDSVSYDSSMGASGDGNSLSRSGSTFVAASPTPGSFSGSVTPAQTSNDNSPEASSSQTSSQVQNANTGSGGPPAITAAIDANDISMVGGGEFFSCHVFGTSGVALLNPRCVWNFGDGSTAEGVRVFHAYNYPGEYEVVLEAAYNYSSATARDIVSANAAAVSLSAEGDGSLTVGNLSESELDVGLWSIVQGPNIFKIPEHTVALVGHGIRFAPEVLGFKGDTSAVLLYPNSALAVSAAAGKASPLRGVSVPLPTVKAANISASKVTSKTSAPVQQTVQTPEVSVDDMSASVAETGAFGVGWTYLVALMAVIATGVIGAYYARMPHSSASETDALADEFEIE